MTYTDIYSIIARYAPSLLLAFEDHDKQFPFRDNANVIAAELRDRAQYYRGDISARLIHAADEVLRQSRQS